MFKQTLYYYKVVIFVFLNLLKVEIKKSIPLPLSKKIQLWRKGFFSKSYALYQFDKTDMSEYISDWQEAFNCKFIYKGTIYIDNKILFPQMVKPFVPMTEEPFLIMEGKLVPIGEKRKATSLVELLTEIETFGPKIFKPVDGASGDGIVKISFENGIWIINQKKATQNECLSLLQSLTNYLVSDFIVQGDYSNKIYPKSVNTVRILTMIDPETGKSFIAAAAQRIGNDQSFPVDNCAAGGFTAGIDIETGKLGKATSTKLQENKLVWFTNHPDTHSPIEGVFIPDWNNLKNSVLAIAQSLFFIPYIGWDIVVTDDGFTIIEANEGPDLKLHQVHSPLLKSESVKRFYKHYKVI